MTKLKTFSLVFLAAAAAAAGFAIERNIRLRLRDENRSLLEQLGTLTTTNEFLSNSADRFISAQSTLSNQIQELLSLRADLARLQNDSSELAQSNAVAQKNDPTYRIAVLKQRLDETPDEKIPELGLLSERDWRWAASFLQESDAAAFARARERAKENFVRRLGPALHLYAQAHDGRLPSALSELKSYFPELPDESVFQRYELRQTGKLVDVPQIDTYPPTQNTGDAEHDALANAVRLKTKSSLPWTQPVVVEKAPVNNESDSLFTVTVWGYAYQSFGYGTGSGSGTWAKVGTNGLPELILPRR